MEYEKEVSFYTMNVLSKKSENVEINYELETSKDEISVQNKNNESLQMKINELLDKDKNENKRSCL